VSLRDLARRLKGEEAPIHFIGIVNIVVQYTTTLENQESIRPIAADNPIEFLDGDIGAFDDAPDAPIDKDNITKEGGYPYPWRGSEVGGVECEPLCILSATSLYGFSTMYEQAT
jgi:hypothetical protein